MSKPAKPFQGFEYDFINRYNASFRPSTVHCHNTALFAYFRRRLIQKIIATFPITGTPKSWNLNYIQYVLFCLGHLAIFDSGAEFGVIAQECSLSGYNIFYQPSKAIIANPKLKKSLMLTIGKDCELVCMQPDYGGAIDIVNTYADLLALCLESAGVNFVNSKVAYVFAAKDKTAAESYKKLYDRIASGEPAAFADEKLFGPDGQPRWSAFVQNLKQNYIATDILNDLENIEDQFNTIIGIPNANTEKRERLITDEVNANNAETGACAVLWTETIREGFKRANERYGLNLGIKYRFEQKEESEVKDNVAVGNGDL